MRALFAAVLALAASAAPQHGPAPATDSRPWLVISDIHYAPYGRAGRSRRPSFSGSDTNPALLDSLFAELVRTEPNPPVIIIAGDFLGHGFPAARAAGTMAELARRFDRTFPRAQFVITLGNNDSSCGDYEEAVDSPFLRATARAWAPLVDRANAAPAFLRTFAHDGGYTARLPRRGLRAVVVDDVFDALRFRNACGTGNPAATSLGDFAQTLAHTPRGERTWVITHVPPGIDAFSTAYLVHHLAVIPFMRPGARERLTDLIDDPADRVALVIAGHIHHFSFRISGTAAAGGRDPVPILIAPSVSPIFRNAPSFLTLDVTTAGEVRSVTEMSYRDGSWRRVGDLASQGVASFTAPQLLGYAERLANGRASREAYATLYEGGAPSEIDRANWPIYFCSITNLKASDMRACLDSGGLGVLTGRGFDLLAAGALAAFGVALAALVLWARVFRRPRLRSLDNGR